MPAVTEEIVYQHAANCPERLGMSSADAFSSALPAGTAVLFDDRILHRGLANQCAPAVAAAEPRAEGRRTGGGASSGASSSSSVNECNVRSVGYFSYRRLEFQADTHFEAFRSLANWKGADAMVEAVRPEFPGRG